MAKVQVGLRLDPALAVAVDAARGLVPRNRFLEELIGRALGEASGSAKDGLTDDGRSPVAGGLAARRLPERPVAPLAGAVPSGPVAKPYCCSYGSGCSFGTTSAKAICPIHGRKVVPV